MNIPEYKIKEYDREQVALLSDTDLATVDEEDELVSEVSTDVLANCNAVFPDVPQISTIGHCGELQATNHSVELFIY